MPHGSTFLRPGRSHRSQKEGSTKHGFSRHPLPTPNEIQFDLNKTNSHILDKKELYYSKNDTNLLKLDLIGTDFNGVHTSQKFKYRFSNATNDESNTIATVNNDKINFLKTGDITITVTSDSSIEGLDELPSTVNEKSYNIVVHVNEGINVRTVSELKAVSTGSITQKSRARTQVTNLSKLQDLNSSMLQKISRENTYILMD